MRRIYIYLILLLCLNNSVLAQLDWGIDSYVDNGNDTYDVVVWVSGAPPENQSTFGFSGYQVQTSPSFSVTENCFDSGLITGNACTTLFSPHCACNGVTYSNQCNANESGYETTSSSPCNGSEQVFFTIENVTCETGDFNIDFLAYYGNGTELGPIESGTISQYEQCTMLDECICPDLISSEPCTSIVDPVCGCDDVTYNNACEAQNAGLTSWRLGACGEFGQFQVPNCEIDHPLGNIGIIQGDCSCKVALDSCICPELIGSMPFLPTVIDPVCGCNGETYENSAVAQNAGVIKWTQGPCNQSCFDDPLDLLWVRDAIERYSEFCDFDRLQKSIFNGEPILIFTRESISDFVPRDIYSCQGDLLQSCVFNFFAGGWQCTVDGGIDNEALNPISVFNICNETLSDVVESRVFCDDGNSNTINDQIQDDCSCKGESAPLFSEVEAVAVRLDSVKFVESEVSCVSFPDQDVFSSCDSVVFRSLLKNIVSLRTVRYIDTLFLGQSIYDSAMSNTITSPIGDCQWYYRTLTNLPVGEYRLKRRVEDINTGEIFPIPDVLITVENHPDLTALIDLFQNTDGSNWFQKGGWQEGVMGLSCNPCNYNGESWDFVRCNNGRVTELTLTSNRLDGEIPESISQLEFLENLSLSKNSLSGDIPNSLASLNRLSRFAIGENNFSGQIPSFLYSMTSVTELWLYDNNFSGEIDPAVSGMSNLRSLALYDNSLSGPIPSEITTLSNLVHLDLSDNNLDGCFADELISFCTLDHFDLNITESLGGSSGYTSSYNFMRNGKLPFEGDYERVCNGELQIGASCDDGNGSSVNDIIQDDCLCSDVPPCDGTYLLTWPQVKCPSLVPLEIPLTITGGLPPYQVEVVVDGISQPIVIFDQGDGSVFLDLQTLSEVVEVNIVDTNGCTMFSDLSGPITTVDAEAPEMSLTILEGEESCLGDMVTFEVTIDGGVAPYDFAVTSTLFSTDRMGITEQTTTFQELLPEAGEYDFFITGTDANGCSNGDAFVPLTHTVTVCNTDCGSFTFDWPQVRCPGLSPLEVPLSILGGQAPYQVEISIDGQVQPVVVFDQTDGTVNLDLITLDETITATIVDANDCDIFIDLSGPINTVDVDAPEFRLNIPGANPSCLGEPLSFEVEIIGGVAPFNFRIASDNFEIERTDITQRVLTIQEILPELGNYQFSIMGTDGNGCFGGDVFTLIDHTVETCNDECGSFSYAWPETACVPTFGVVVPLTISGGQPPYQVDVSYNGNQGGSYTDVVDPIELLFSPQDLDAVITTTIVDATGCSNFVDTSPAQNTELLTGPEMTFSILQGTTSCLGDEVTYQVEIEGGSPPYEFRITGGPDFESIQTGVVNNLFEFQETFSSSQEYTLSIFGSDSNGCPTSDIVFTINHTVENCSPDCKPIAWIDPPADITLSCIDFEALDQTLAYSNNDIDVCLEEGEVQAAESIIVDECEKRIILSYEATGVDGTTISHVQTIQLLIPEAEWTSSPDMSSLSCIDFEDEIQQINFSNGAMGICEISGTAISEWEVYREDCLDKLAITWQANDECADLSDLTEVVELTDCPSSFNLTKDIFPTEAGIAQSKNILRNDQVPSDVLVTYTEVSDLDNLDFIFNENGDISFTLIESTFDSMVVQYEVCDLECLVCDTSQFVIVDESLKDIKLINILTPGDGSGNSVLQFTEAEEIPNSELWIYNRWGDEIFHAINYTNDWDADGFPGGVYFYVLKIGDVITKKTITLIR